MAIIPISTTAALDIIYSINQTKCISIFLKLLIIFYWHEILLWFYFYILYGVVYLLTCQFDRDGALFLYTHVREPIRVYLHVERGCVTDVGRVPTALFRSRTCNHSKNDDYIISSTSIIATRRATWNQTSIRLGDVNSFIYSIRTSNVES